MGGFVSFDVDACFMRSSVYFGLNFVFILRYSDVCSCRASRRSTAPASLYGMLTVTRPPYERTLTASFLVGVSSMTFCHESTAGASEATSSAVDAFSSLRGFPCKFAGIVQSRESAAALGGVARGSLAGSYEVVDVRLDDEAHDHC